MRRVLVLAFLAAACGRKAASPAGVGDVAEAARLLFAALEADDFERLRILVPTTEEAARLGPWAGIDFERESRNHWFDWDVAVYRGYVQKDNALVLYVEASPDASREQFYDIRFGVARVERGWVLCGPFYCAGRLGDLPALER